MPVHFGVGAAPVEPLSKLKKTVKLAEDLGYDYQVHADQRFAGEKDVFVTLSAEAGVTDRINLGPCISDPFTRIPAMLASAIASLDELSGHRAILTLGAGGSGFAQMHLERAHVNLALREAMHIIRGLFSGEAVTFDGKMYRVTGAKLNFPTRPDIPIYLATRSPLNLRLAGELADGAVIASYASPEQIKWAIEMVRKGAKKAGRTLKDIKLVSWVYAGISDDGKSAVDSVRSFTTGALLNTSSEAYPSIFKGIQNDVGGFLTKCKAMGSEGSKLANADREYLTDDVIKRFSVAGTPDDCVAKVREIAALGIDTIWLRCFSAPHSQVNHEDVFVPFAEKVLPHFK